MQKGQVQPDLPAKVPCKPPHPTFPFSAAAGPEERLGEQRQSDVLPRRRQTAVSNAHTVTAVEGTAARPFISSVST